MKAISTQQLVLTFVLFFGIVLDFVVLGARTALRHVNLARLLHLRELQRPKAHRVLALVERMPQPYASLHVAQTLARVLLVGVGILLFVGDALDGAWLLLGGVLLLAGVLFAWLEWMLERHVMRAPETWLLRWLGVTQVLQRVFSPLGRLSLFFSREQKNPVGATSVVTAEDLKTLVDVGQQDGIIEQDESKMIQSIFQLGNTLTREIMVPRIDIRALEIGTPLPDAVDLLLATGYSRLPVYAETIDNILGLLYAKDLLRVWREGNGQDTLHEELLREAYFVPEAKKVDELLDELQRRRVHMAIVVDEYGGVAGLVTLEDIIEEIFGEIRDEYDEGEELPYVQVDEGEYIFRGRIDLDDFNEIMETNLPNDDADTLSGYIYTRLGHVPEAGESIAEDGLILTVEQVSERRIRKVRAQRVWETAVTDVE